MIDMEKIDFLEGQISFTFDKNIEVRSIIRNGKRQITVLYEESNEQDLSPEFGVPSENQTDKHFSDIIENKNLAGISLDNTNFPTVEEIMNFIKSNENYEYDNVRVQEHFFGRPINSREDRTVYNHIVDLTTQAKFKISSVEKGNWKDKGNRLVDNNRRTKVYIFEHDTESTATE
jgi:hypothetical protein